MVGLEHKRRAVTSVLEMNQGYQANIWNDPAFGVFPASRLEIRCVRSNLVSKLRCKPT